MENGVQYKKNEKKEQEEKVDSKLLFVLSKDELKDWLFGIIMPEIHHKQFRWDLPTGKPATYSIHLPSNVYSFLFEFTTQSYENEDLLSMLPNKGWCLHGGFTEITKVGICSVYLLLGGLLTRTFAFSLLKGKIRKKNAGTKKVKREK